MTAPRPTVFDETRALLGSDAVDTCLRRLHAPLHIALTGTLKAGKSTLLNALVGAEIAASDATECTRLVTHYRYAPQPRTDALDAAGGRTPVDVREALPPGTTELEVALPDPLLRRYRFVDTPGTSSATRHVSARTMAYLDPDDGVCPADAVVHLTRSLHEDDLALLTRIRAQAGSGGPVALIGVLSRADEESGDRAAPHGFLPVSGHLALRSATLNDAEFAAVSALAARPDRGALLVSPGRFLAGTGDDRLLDRWGMHGLETAIELVDDGARDPAALAAALRARSGIDALRRSLHRRVDRRAVALRHRGALRELRGRVAAVSGAGGLLARIDAELAADATLAELRALGALPTATGLTVATRDALERLLGGLGTDPPERLGLDRNADADLLRTAAAHAAAHWRGRLDDPLLDPVARTAVRTAVRSAEAIVAGAVRLAAPATR